jgi:hypothetical protein
MRKANAITGTDLSLVEFSPFSKHSFKNQTLYNPPKDVNDNGD